MRIRFDVRVIVTWGAWTIWSFLLGASVALFLNTVLFGRVPILELARGWQSGLTLKFTIFVVMGWWLLYGVLLSNRRELLRLRDALVPSALVICGVIVPIIAIYASDLVNHYFHYSMIELNQPKPLALLLIILSSSVLLQLIHLNISGGSGAYSALRRAVTRSRESFILVFLSAMGLLQGSAYLDRLFDDFVLRYWPIADALITGVPYPAAVVEGIWRPFFIEGGLTKYLIDLPFYPILVAISFSIIGHNAVAAYAPTVLSNIVLPCATYLLFKEVVRNKTVALSLVALVTFFPPLRFYVLNWTLPDTTFFVLLMFCCWFFVKLANGDSRGLTWTLFGLSAATVTLTRPEGAAYAGIYMLAALFMKAGIRQKTISLVLFTMPVAAFSVVMMTTFAMPWPRNWLGSLGVHNVVGNWQMLSAGPLQAFADSVRLSTDNVVISSVMLLFFSFVGTAPIVYHRRLLAVLYIPAWINFISVLLVDPRVSGARLWYDFFRHMSYVLPLFVLAAGAALVTIVQIIRWRIANRMAFVFVNVLLFTLVMWNMHLLSKPSYNFGDDAGNLLGAGRFNLVDIIDKHPFELQLFEFRQSDGYWVVTAWSDSLWGYPDHMADFFGSFDAVRRTTGTSYQTASLYLYLAALVTTLLPAESISRRKVWGEADLLMRSIETDRSG